MVFDIKLAASAILSRQVIEEMITKCVSEQTARKVERIDFTLVDVSGDMDRYPNYELACCKVFFEDTLDA